MSKVFFDTNLLIAFVFLINSFHDASEKVFKEYQEYFYSSFVQEEFERRFGKKQLNLKKFYHDFKMSLKNSNKELYSIDDLKKFANHHYSGNLLGDAKNSVNSFWKEYVGIESQISFVKMRNAIEFSLKDISITSNSSKDYLDNIMQLTPERVKSYSAIEKMLESEGVGPADRTVTLDGHDFACNSFQPVDFVTFDVDCYNGAKNVGMLCFSSIKGKDDFKSS